MKQPKTHSLAALFLLPFLLAAGGKAMATEEPDFTVVKEENGIEYRRYDTFIKAQTLVEDARDRGSASSQGFRRLFRYISGANRVREKIEMTTPVIQAGEDSPGEKIAMTAPVQQTATEAGWLVAFVLPRDYTMDSAPVPEDTRITRREVPARTMAVLRFSGRWTDANIERHRDRLLATLEEAGIPVNDKVEFAAYDAPFALPFMRRNEVMVEIAHND